jgi:hypothetical protein
MMLECVQVPKFLEGGAVVSTYTVSKKDEGHVGVADKHPPPDATDVLSGGAGRAFK